MPSDGKYGFSVHISGIPVPEYTKDGLTYVESNLWTPVSYKQNVRELVFGEIEEQEWPVTPYTIKVTVEPFCPESWIEIYVDGVRVDRRVLGGERRAKEWECKGFNDADGVREFLFALPRFARDENDRVSSNRASSIGTIEVVRKLATYLRDETRPVSKGTDTQFEQANKKDAFGITEGKHTMSTTKKGKLVKKTRHSHGVHTSSIFSIGDEVGRLTVNYHMPYTLERMGIKLDKVDWKQNHGGSTSMKSE